MARGGSGRDLAVLGERRMWTQVRLAGRLGKSDDGIGDRELQDLAVSGGSSREFGEPGRGTYEVGVGNHVHQRHIV